MSPMYLCDTHTHSLISADCDARLSDMVSAAIRLNLSEFCTTDHCDLLDADGNLNDRFDWTAAKAQYHDALPLTEGRLALRLGIELGSIIYRPDLARRILAEGGDELDFVLGSLHNWIGSHGNIELYLMDFSVSQALCREAVDCYLRSTLALVRQCPDCYDSLAHLVYPMRYIRRDGRHVPITDYEEPIRQILAELVRTDHALEVNTCRATDMEHWSLLLRWYRECGGKLITVGSDAHTPEDVAKGIPTVLELIKAAGFDSVATYEKRRPVLHKL